MEFKEISFWDGKDKETDVIAKFSLKFETITGKKHWTYSLKKRSLQRKLKKEIQEIADENFGKKKTKVKVVSLIEKSIEVNYDLIVVAGAVYLFIKDYSTLRKSFINLKQDIISASNYLESKVNRGYYGKRYARTIRKDDNISSTDDYSAETEYKNNRALNTVKYSIGIFLIWFFITMLGIGMIGFWLLVALNQTGNELLHNISNIIYWIILFLVSYGYFFVMALEESYEEGAITGITIASILAGICLFLSPNICAYSSSLQPGSNLHVVLFISLYPLQVVGCDLKILFIIFLALLFPVVTIIGAFMS